MFNVMLWNKMNECITRGFQTTFEFETLQDAVDFSLTQNSEVKSVLINQAEYTIEEFVGLSGDPVRILLNNRCKGCGGCQLVTATFCNVAILEAKDFTYTCIADNECGCLGEEAMYLKRKVK